MAEKKSVLFVCLGNICRSPIAEAVFAHLVKEKGQNDQWDIDSAALGDWHTGNKPDCRAIACLKEHGAPTEARARLLIVDDFTKFDYIFGMDDQNMKDINRRAPKGSYKAKLLLLGEYDPKKKRIIEDPYYSDDDAAFETVYQQCVRCCQAFLDDVSK